MHDNFDQVEDKTLVVRVDLFCKKHALVQVQDINVCKCRSHTNFLVT